MLSASFLTTSDMDWSSIQPLFTWLSEHPAWSGLIVFLIALTESLFIIGLLVPGTVLMFGVGTLVGTGVLDIQETILYAFAGAVIGDGISYWIGRRYHKQFSNIWPIKNNPHYLNRGKYFFAKHGGKSILFGRFIGPVRPIIPAVAGMMGMPVKYFFTMNIFSAAAWAPFYLLPGIVFGTSIGLASAVGLRLMGLLIVALVFSLLLIWLARQFYFVIVLPMNYHIRVICISIFFAALSSILVIQYLAQDDVSKIFKVTITKNQWKTEIFTKLSPQRQDFFATHQPMNIQWMGNINAIRKNLLAEGWCVSPALNYRSALYWLKPSAVFSELPQIPQTHRGVQEALILIQCDQQSRDSLILQLWPSEYKIKTNDSRLWVGSVTKRRINSFANWFSYAESRTLSPMEINEFKASLQRSFITQLADENNKILLIEPK